MDLADYPGARHEQLDPYLVGQLYLAPYLAFEPAGVVVVTVLGRVQGYVAGTSDSVGFERFLEAEWLPRVRVQYPVGLAGLHPRDQAFLASLHRARRELPPWLERYPAHLHADLLPACQGRGLGRRLVTHFYAYVQRLGCAGVHVDVARRNAGAIRFYQALGLDLPLEDTPSGVALGKHFD